MQTTRDMVWWLDFDAPETEAYCTCPDHAGPRLLPIDQFRPRPDRPSGVYSWCLACEREAARRRKAHRKMIDLRARWTAYGLHLRERHSD